MVKKKNSNNNTVHIQLQMGYQKCQNTQQIRDFTQSVCVFGLFRKWENEKMK